MPELTSTTIWDTRRHEAYEDAGAFAVQGKVSTRESAGALAFSRQGLCFQSCPGNGAWSVDKLTGDAEGNFVRKNGV